MPVKTKDIPREIFKSRTNAKFPLLQYPSLIHEAKSITNMFQNEPTMMLITDSYALKTTVINMMLTKSRDHCLHRQLLDLVIDTAFLLYTSSTIRSIDHISKNEFYRYRSLDFKKPYETQNFIIEIKENFIKNHQNSSLDTTSFHKKFLEHIVDQSIIDEIKNIFKVLQAKINLPCSAVGSCELYLASFMSNNIHDYFTDSNAKINIFEFHEDHLTYDGTKKWFAALDLLDQDKLNQIMMHQHSEHIYSGCYDEEKTVRNQIQSHLHHIKTKHLSAKPKPELRKKEFAINHIIKLVNNPYHFFVECILQIKQSNYHPNHLVGILIHSLIEYCISCYKLIHSVEDAYNAMKSKLDQYKHTKSQKALIESKLEGIANVVWKIIKNSSEIFVEQEGMQKIQYHDSEYTLYGRADLIYKNLDGQYGIFDFKTGYVPSWIDLTNGTAPQISLGILMLSLGAFTDKQDISIDQITDCGFISPNKLMKLSNLNTLIDVTKRGMASLIEHFWVKNNEYTYIPTNNMLNKCIARQYDKDY